MTYSYRSGTLFPIGVTTVTVTARDSSSNVIVATFTVSVVAATLWIAREGNSFRLCYVRVPGRTCAVQFTDDLRTPNGN